MTGALAHSSNPLSKPSTTLSPEGWERAKKRLAAVENLTEHSALIDAGSCDRIIATADASLRPCTPKEALALSLELIGCYPDLTMSATPKQQADLKVYGTKMAEAFAQFSAEIGRVIVSTRAGVAGSTRFKPTPADVVACGNEEVQLRHNIKTMAYRHKAEAKRRAEDQAERDRAASTPRDPERVKRVLAQYHLNKINDPFEPRKPTPAATEAA